VFGAVAGASAVMLSMDGGSDHHDREYRSGRNLVMQSGSQSSNPMRTVLTVAMGGAAVLSTGAALAVIFSKPKKPEEPKVDVGFSPVGVVVSGTFR
jgi:hypothetical protein